MGDYASKGIIGSFKNVAGVPIESGQKNGVDNPSIDIATEVSYGVRDKWLVLRTNGWLNDADRPDTISTWEGFRLRGDGLFDYVTGELIDDMDFLVALKTILSERGWYTLDITTVVDTTAPFGATSAQVLWAAPYKEGGDPYGGWYGFYMVNEGSDTDTGGSTYTRIFMCHYGPLPDPSLTGFWVFLAACNTCDADHWMEVPNISFRTTGNYKYWISCSRNEILCAIHPYETGSTVEWFHTGHEIVSMFADKGDGNNRRYVLSTHCATVDRGDDIVGEGIAYTRWDAADYASTWNSHTFNCGNSNTKDYAIQGIVWHEEDDGYLTVYEIMHSYFQQMDSSIYMTGRSTVSASGYYPMFPIYLPYYYDPDQDWWQWAVEFIYLCNGHFRTQWYWKSSGVPAGTTAQYLWDIHGLGAGDPIYAARREWAMFDYNDNWYRFVDEGETLQMLEKRAPGETEWIEGGEPSGWSYDSVIKAADYAYAQPPYSAVVPILTYVGERSYVYDNYYVGVWEGGTIISYMNVYEEEVQAGSVHTAVEWDSISVGTLIEAGYRVYVWTLAVAGMQTDSDGVIPKSTLWASKAYQGAGTRSGVWDGRRWKMTDEDTLYVSTKYTCVTPHLKTADWLTDSSNFTYNSGWQILSEWVGGSAVQSIDIVTTPHDQTPHAAGLYIYGAYAIRYSRIHRQDERYTLRCPGSLVSTSIPGTTESYPPGDIASAWYNASSVNPSNDPTSEYCSPDVNRLLPHYAVSAVINDDISGTQFSAAGIARTHNTGAYNYPGGDIFGNYMWRASFYDYHESPPVYTVRKIAVFWNTTHNYWEAEVQCHTHDNEYDLLSGAVPGLTCMCCPRGTYDVVSPYSGSVGKVVVA